MSKFHTILKSVSVLGSLLLFNACGADNTTQKKVANTIDNQKVSKNNVLTFCLSDTFNEIEPGTTYEYLDATNIMFVSEGLFGFAKDSADISNVLAKSYEVSSDNLVYTFHLRQGVKWQTTPEFSPSHEFNADDVVFSLKRQLSPNHPYYQKKYAFMDGMGLTDFIKDIQKVDDYTVQIILNKPMATLVPNLASTWLFGMVPKEYYENMKNQGKLEYVYRHPVGTGPWVFVSNKNGEYTRFKSNPDYWAGQTKSKYLVAKAITDPSQFLNAVETGECDITQQLDTSAMTNVTKDQYKNVTLKPRNVLTTWYLMVNHNANPALANKYVRQAIAYAIDRNRIIKDAYSGQGIAATSFIPPDIFGGFPEKTAKYKYNLKKAKQLLAKAGYPGGKGIPTMKYIFSKTSTQARPMALIIQDNLKAIGINIVLEKLSSSQTRKLTRAGQYDMSVTSWGADFPDPDNFYASRLGVHGVNNLSNWKNDKFLNLIQKAATYSDMDTRLKLYEQAAENFADEMPIMPIVYPTGYYAISKQIHDYYAGPMENSMGTLSAYKTD